MRVGAFVSLSVVLVLGAASAFAQTTTGRLIGSVVDETAQALPEATITISSPVLIGGALEKNSNVAGEFIFVGIAPGLYTVKIDLPGFVSQERREVKVPLGGAASLRVEMPLASFESEIEVVAETPMVDPTQVNTGLIFDASYLQDAALGSRNRSYQEVLAQAPGVSGGGNPSVFGSTPAENAYFIDGMNTNDPVTSTFGTNFSFDAIQEIQFQTSGFEAQYGQATGGLVNLVTKSGGNRISGTLDVRYSGDSFQSSGDHYDPSVQETSFETFDVTLGGPILRDRLWYFLAYRLVRSSRTPSESPTTREFDGNYPIAKLTWQVSPRWRATGKYSADPADITNQNASRFVAEDATEFQDQGSRLATFELDAVLSDTLIWNTVVGTFNSKLDSYPTSGDLEAIQHWDIVTGYQYNNFRSQQYSKRDRFDATTNLTWFVSDLAGSHEFKAGLGYQNLDFEFSSCSTGTSGGERCAEGVSGLFYQELPGNAPFYMIETISGGTSKSSGTIATGYLQDTWRVTPNVTLKLGVRYDGAQFDNDTGEQVADLPKWQPRVAAAWDITGDAKNVIRANWGQFMDPSALNLPDSARTVSNANAVWLSCTTQFGLDAASCQAFAGMLGFNWRTDPENQDPAGWLSSPFAGSGGQPNRIADGLKAMYAEEFSLSYEREVGQRSAVEVTYINKETKDIFEDTCAGNWPGPPSATADCSYFIMANLEPLTREYQGFILKYETRTFDWLTLLTSYTYSKSKGSIGYTQNVGTDYDRYPVDWTNRYGYMGDHRLHRFKLNGFFSIKGDWTLGFDAFYESPFTWQPQANTADDPTIPPGHFLFLEPRGSREANSNHQIDLQLSKGFSIGALRVVLIGTVYNVASSEQGIAVCQSVSGCGVDGNLDPIMMGDSTEWQRPRSYEVGLRFEF